jgi:hypothetical protein
MRAKSALFLFTEPIDFRKVECRPIDFNSSFQFLIKTQIIVEIEDNGVFEMESQRGDFDRLIMSVSNSARLLTRKARRTQRV